jgi:hypothetical protein
MTDQPSPSYTMYTVARCLRALGDDIQDSEWSPEQIAKCLGTYANLLERYADPNDPAAFVARPRLDHVNARGE